jgi:hypothetical protein
MKVVYSNYKRHITEFFFWTGNLLNWLGYITFLDNYLMHYMYVT